VECYEILDDAVRAALEEIADPAFAATRAAAAGVESKNSEVHRRDDDEDEEKDCGPDAV
jgi:Arc/MetJ family transcription regulator